jgi:RND family efflux transporter MFP subunit
MMTKIFIPLFLIVFSSSATAELSEAKRLLASDNLLQDKNVKESVQKNESDSCLLTPSIDIEVASPVVGVIKNVNVKRGDRVKQNQILVQLHAEVEKATLKLNKAQADYGKRTIKRNNDLYKRKLISEQERDEIIMNNQVYSYEMAQTKELVKQKTIRSPLTGVVVNTFLDKGEFVGEEPIMQIVALDPLYVEVVLPASRFGSIKKGDVATVTLDAPLNSMHKAKVIIIDPVLDAASGTFGVRLELPNPDYALPAGLKCQVRL